MEGSETSAKDVISAFDETWTKLRAFVKTQQEELKLPEEALLAVNTIMERDVLIFVPIMQDFFEKHKEALARRDEAYFRALAPKEWQDVKISDETRDKAFLYMLVFQSLLRDLSEQ